MPQVQVALRRRANGEMIKGNEVIPYIITGEGNLNANAADRARSPQELKSDPTLKPGNK